MSVFAAGEMMDPSLSDTRRLAAAQYFFSNSRVAPTADEMRQLMTSFDSDDSRLTALRTALACVRRCNPRQLADSGVWAIVVEVCSAMDEDKGRYAAVSLFFPNYIDAENLSRVLATFASESKRHSIFRHYLSYFKIWSDEDIARITTLFSGELKEDVLRTLVNRRDDAAAAAFLQALAPVPIAAVRSLIFDMNNLSGVDSKAAEGSPSQCAACSENEKRVAMVPCGHVCLCIACAKRLPKPYACPMCRGSITSALTVFY